MSRGSRTKRWAHAAGRTLLEGLRSAGRLLSRERVNRRIGAQGTYVVTVDPTGKVLVPAGEPVPLE